MDWAQVLTLFLANAGLIFWFRAESRADWRHMDNKLDVMGNKFDASIKAMDNKLDISIKAIQEEMKDFHTRLALQDQEFKMSMKAIEMERIRSK